jgi:tetrahydromethanopterin S-methyltransferase subunit G
MIKKILFIFLFSLSLQANSEIALILKEIKNLREDMNNKFEQVDKRLDIMQHNMDKRFDMMQHNMDKRFEQVDKRFEQVDKRFEQVDKRFEQVDKHIKTVFNILYILMGLIFASPFIAIYLRDKKEAEDRQSSETIKSILFALRELAQNDEKVAKSLKMASLL